MSSAPWLLLHHFLSPACQAFQAGFAVQASPVWQVPEEGMSSLLWLLQRARARPRLAPLQHGKLGFEQGTAGLGLSQHRQQAGREARREEQIFDGVFQLVSPLFFLFCSLKARPTAGDRMAEEQHLCSGQQEAFPLL